MQTNYVQYKLHFCTMWSFEQYVHNVIALVLPVHIFAPAIFCNFIVHMSLLGQIFPLSDLSLKASGSNDGHDKIINVCKWRELISSAAFWSWKYNILTIVVKVHYMVTGIGYYSKSNNIVLLMSQCIFQGFYNWIEFKAVI